jgi:hypothetical protein
MPFLAAIPAAIAGISSLAGGAAGIAAAAAPVVGGVINGLSDKSTTTRSGINMAPASAMENAASAGMMQDYSAMRGMVDAGPGASDVTAGTNSARDLASMLGQYQQSGGMPGAQDITQANTAAGGLFQGQRMALKQNFMDQETQNAQNAAVMGRGMNDPVLRNKLMQEQTRQQMQLDANQGSLSQQLAMAMPGQRLGYATQKTNVLQGLASQAMSNRQALLAMGEGMQTNERNFRLQSGERYGEQTQKGSIGGAIAGGLAGLGAGLSAASGFQSGGSGGGGGAQPFSLGAIPKTAGGQVDFGVGKNLGGGSAVKTGRYTGDAGVMDRLMGDDKWRSQ